MPSIPAPLFSTTLPPIPFLLAGTDGAPCATSRCSQLANLNCVWTLAIHITDQMGKGESSSVTVCTGNSIHTPIWLYTRVVVSTEMPYNHSKVEFWYLELQQFFSTFGGQTVVISLIARYANGLCI